LKTAGIVIESLQNFGSIPNLGVHDGGGATRLLPRMRMRKNSAKTQQSGHAPMSRPEAKDGRSSAEDGTSERLIYETIQKEN